MGRVKTSKPPVGVTDAVHRLEKVEQRAILALLGLAGFDCYVIDQGGRDKSGRRTPGVADIYAIHRRLELAVWVETKRTKYSRVRAAQKEFRERCLRARQHHVIGAIRAVQLWLIQVGIADPYGATVRIRKPTDQGG